MPTLFDVYPADLIEAIADKLEGSKKVKPPKEAMFWKTGHFKEYPPDEWPRFWYIRAASLLRKIYKTPIGINRLKKAYGGRKTGTHVHINHTYSGSGKIIRLILQQLEKEGYVTTLEKKGRSLTNKGKSLLDSAAAEILKESIEA